MRIMLNVMFVCLCKQFSSDGTSTVTLVPYETNAGISIALHTHTQVYKRLIYNRLLLLLVQHDETFLETIIYNHSCRDRVRERKNVGEVEDRRPDVITSNTEILSNGPKTDNNANHDCIVIGGKLEWNDSIT